MIVNWSPGVKLNKILVEVLKTSFKFYNGDIKKTCESLDIEEQTLRQILNLPTEKKVNNLKRNLN
jgi:hypothetical protein